MRNLRLEGKYVYLEEVQPKYFPYIIEWRNNPDNNRFLNQPFKLTMELQNEWYVEKYLNDFSQYLFLLIDKEHDTPFGTLGITEFNENEKICIFGRALIGLEEYRGTRFVAESIYLLNNYIYDALGVDTIFIHVVKENRSALMWNKRWGFSENKGIIRFPNELLVNGMSQIELYRKKEEYFRIKLIMKNIIYRNGK